MSKKLFLISFVYLMSLLSEGAIAHGQLPVEEWMCDDVPTAYPPMHPLDSWVLVAEGGKEIPLSQFLESPVAQPVESISVADLIVAYGGSPHPSNIVDYVLVPEGPDAKLIYEILIAYGATPAPMKTFKQ